MKLSDYVASYLASLGIREVFVVTGGAAAALIDSIAHTPNLRYVCSQHEQAAAMAVDAYARVTRNLGAAIATTGPGVMNLVTGIACAYYDSLPAIFLGGQVATFRLKRATGVRQLGFQECDAVALLRSVTKYAVLVDDPLRIRYELDKATHIAREGRPGPVFLDIPDDVQRADIDPQALSSFTPDPPRKDLSALQSAVEQVLPLLAQAERPILVLGGALKVARLEAQARVLAERLQFPVALTWAMMDVLPRSHPLNTWGFGISSTRAGNLAIQNADLILSIGSRLDTHATGSPSHTFARGAKKIVVDIDAHELAKFEAGGLHVDLPILADVADFLPLLLAKSEALCTRDVSAWLAKIHAWQAKYPVCPPEYHAQKEHVNPYVFLEALAKEAPDDAIVIVDCGSNLIQTFQGFAVKGTQLLFSAFNASPMGYALAASIGAKLAAPSRPVLCLIGDGGLQVNIQELATIVRYGLPIKIFLFNNHGYGIIKQTQDDWYDSRYEASTPETGLADLDYLAIAQAYGLETFHLESHASLQGTIGAVLGSKGAVLCNVDLSPAQRIIPMLQYGRPIEDPWPLLPRQEFLENMIVEPTAASLKPRDR